MPRIQGLLENDLIAEDLQATDKAGVITDEAAVFEIVMQRETVTTGISDGIAIPHGRMPGLNGIMAAFGRSRRGVYFESPDGKPAHHFFLFLTPEDRPGDHLLVLRRLARITRDPVFRERRQRATDRQEMQKLILDQDDRYRDCA